MDTNTKECIDKISQILSELIVIGYNFYGEGWVNKQLSEVEKLKESTKEQSFTQVINSGKMSKFKCPYCHKIVKRQSKKQWIKSWCSQFQRFVRLQKQK